MVPEPSPALNSWRARSTSALPGEDEKVTVNVEEPSDVTVPSHSSLSCEPSGTARRRVHELTPPPLKEETVAVDEETLTTATTASPTARGDTTRLETPDP